MSLTGQINAYWARNSILYSNIPASSFYVEIIPERTALPFAVLSLNKFSSDYTCGDPYLITYDFTITVWSNSLVTTQQIGASVVSQFQGQTVVPNQAGCWHEDTVDLAEEHNEEKRYGYGAAMKFRLVVNKTLTGQIWQAQS